VERHRSAGDPLAAAIMGEARDELVSLVGSVRESARESLHEPAIALTGGLFEHNAWLKGAVRAALSEDFPEIALVEPRRDGAFGACMLALELALGPLGGEGRLPGALGAALRARHSARCVPHSALSAQRSASALGGSQNGVY